MTKQLPRTLATLGLATALCMPLLALAQTDTAATTSQAGEPTIAQIYQAAESGKTADADRMMARVLADHPDSAKAHYVHAELLSKEGKLAAAKSEFDRANELAPGLPFVKPESAAELRQRIDPSTPVRRADAPVRSSTSGAGFNSEPAPAVTSSFSPGRIALGVLLIGMLFFVFRRFAGNPVSRPSVPQGPYGQGGQGGAGMPSYGGVPPGYAPNSMNPMNPMNPAPGAARSGIGGALLTGAAAGLGAVAVEEAVRHFSERGGDSRVTYDNRRGDDAGFGNNLGPDTNADMGGNDFGISDPGSWDSGGSDPGGDWN